MHKALQFVVQVSVLTVQHAAVVAKGFNLTSAVVVSYSHRLVGKSHFFLFAAGDTKTVVGISVLSFEVIQVGGHVSVAGELTFCSSSEVSLLGELGIKGPRLGSLFFLKSGLLVAAAMKVNSGAVVSFGGSSEVVVTSFSYFLHISSLFLGLIQRIICGLNSLGSFSVLALLEAVNVTEAVDFLLVADLVFTLV